MTDLQDANHISSGDRTEGEGKQFLEDMLARVKEGPGGAAQTELTIASGAVTPEAALHTVDTESDDPADTLTTLAITTLSEGAIVYLWAANAGRAVTVQHLNAGADGEISLARSANKALSTSTPLVLKRVGVHWQEVPFGPGTASVIVRAAATANIDLSAPGANIDSVAMSAGQWFITPAQSASEQNGIYAWNGAAVPATRAADFASYDAHPGVTVTVQEGAVNADTQWLCTSNVGGTLDTTALEFVFLKKAGRRDGARNAFINGGFDVWQENTSFSGAAAGTTKHVCDGFYCVSAGAAVTSIARSSTLRTGARGTYRTLITGAASVTTVNFGQCIEARDIRKWKRTDTFSAWIYNNSGAAFTPLLFGYTAATGLDDYTATNTVINGVSLQECPDGEVTRVTWSGDISGFTDIGNGLALEVQIPSGFLVAGDEVGFEEWQLEEGEIPDPQFVIEPYDKILLSCWRRLRTVTNDAIGFAEATNRPGNGCIVHPVPMRVTPTISGASFNASTGANGTPANSGNNVNKAAFYNGANNWTVNASINMAATFDARLKR